MTDDDGPRRDLTALAVPRWGRLLATGDHYGPYRLIDPEGATVEPIAVYFQELLAAGKASSRVGSYGMDLLQMVAVSAGSRDVPGTEPPEWRPGTSAGSQAGALRFLVRETRIRRNDEPIADLTNVIVVRGQEA
ncbi:hypothetical protein ACTWPT_18650 [Nonomuraea sp. 3N208]|uniref:hypothetical protein n=1 Tax=Nonomuraea sp. 3N208 TaxID=3457421 RepID=UPI003FCD54CF